MRRRQTRRLQHLAYILRHLRAPLRRHQIDLGQGDETARETEQFDDGQMLACLRHDAVVGGNDEQDEIDAGRTREHVAHEFLVPGNVDEAEDAAVRGRQVGEAEIDRDPARLLFLQPIRVDAGERAHERRLAVIDVSGCADDHVRSAGPRCAARSAVRFSRKSRSSSRQRTSSSSA